jgi:hypothetical protein
MIAKPRQLDETLQRVQRGRALKEALLMTNQADWWVPYAQPLLDAVSLFEELGIRYALAGGIAAMYYGRARFTEDVDFVAVSGHDQTLAAHADVMQKHHFDSSCTYKLYHQSGVQIDLWKDEHADAIVLRASQAQLAGRTVRIVDVYDLLAMKLRAGRVKDDYDISEIVRENAIDEDRLRSLVSPDQFQHFVGIRNRQ